jgi:hypothetical protein
MLGRYFALIHNPLLAHCRTVTAAQPVGVASVSLYELPGLRHSAGSSKGEIPAPRLSNPIRLHSWPSREIGQSFTMKASPMSSTDQGGGKRRAVNADPHERLATASL